MFGVKLASVQFSYFSVLSVCLIKYNHKKVPVTNPTSIYYTDQI